MMTTGILAKLSRGLLFQPTSANYSHSSRQLSLPQSIEDHLSPTSPYSSQRKFVIKQLKYLKQSYSTKHKITRIFAKFINKQTGNREYSRVWKTRLCHKSLKLELPVRMRPLRRRPTGICRLEYSHLVTGIISY